MTPLQTAANRSERTDKKPKFTANTVAFISCRSRLTILLLGTARAQREEGGGGAGNWARLTDAAKE